MHSLITLFRKKKNSNYLIFEIPYKPGASAQLSDAPVLCMGILDGDYIIVEQTNTAQNGEVIVALVDDSATVKRFYAEDGHFRLQPENDFMEPIIVDHVEILGKVIRLIRTLVD